MKLWEVGGEWEDRKLWEVRRENVREKVREVGCLEYSRLPPMNHSKQRYNVTDKMKSQKVFNASSTRTGSLAS